MGSLIAAALIALFAGLFFLGLLPVSAKRAAMFVGGGVRSGSTKAVFTRCTGRIIRVIRFRESRSYGFRFSPQLRSGALTARILGGGGNPLLTLDAGNTTGILSARRGGLYILVLRFENATGEYHLDWE